MHEFALNILYIVLLDQHFVGHLVEQVWFGRTVYCHATDGPPGPSVANYVAMDGPPGPSMATIDGPPGPSVAP